MLSRCAQARRKFRSGLSKVPSAAAALTVAIAASLFMGIVSPGAAAPPVGMNMNDDMLYVDAMKNGSSFYDFAASPGNPNFSIDANGWPTSDAAVNFWDYRVNMPWNGPDPNAVAHDVSGTYKMSFNGSATLQSQSGGLFTVSNQVYNSGTNITTLDLTFPAGEETAFIRFVNTKRTSASATNTGITNVKLIRPGYPTTGGLPNASTPTFTDPYTGLNLAGHGSIHMLTDYTTLRWMGLNATNGDKNDYFAGGDANTPKYPAQLSWATRRTPSFAYQSVGPKGVGMTWEYIVQLSNQMNKDVWISVPVAASDDYVTKLAQLFKYGSDGTNPYTSTQASPVWAPLNANLHIYIEYANEVWNSTLGASYFYVQDMSNDPNVPAPARGWVGNAYPWRAMQISNLFKAVYGAGAMNTTIRPVLAWQSPGGGMSSLNYQFQLIASNWGTPSSFFYGGCGAPYFGPSNVDSDLNTLFADMNDAITSPTTTNSTVRQGLQITAVSKYWGLKSLCYEGGPALQGSGSWALLLDDGDRDARMTTTCLTYYNTLYGTDGIDLFNQLDLVGIEAPGPGMWQTYEDPTKNTVRSASFDQFVAAAAPPVTAGTALPTTTGSPATIAAGAYTLNQAGNFGTGTGNTGIGGAGNYLMYLLRNTTGATTTYTVTLNSGECCPGPTKMLEILVDSAVVGGPFQIPANGVNTAPFTFTLGAGLHSVEVAGMSTSGSTINYLTINYVSSVAGATATFVKTDTTTQGNWKPVYGADGYNVINDPSAGNPHYPSYATVSTAAWNFTWAASSADVRALTKSAAGSTDRIAAQIGDVTAFDIDCNITDGNTHQVALYALDWDTTVRAETIQVLDAGTSAVLDSQSVSAFNAGKYLVWNIKGHVKFHLIRTGGANCTVSGIFFGIGVNSGPSATYVRTDTTTQGNWKTLYGVDGYNVINDPSAGNPHYPSYATGITTTASNFTWAASTTDVRALTKSATGSTDRIAAQWYNASNFTIDCPITDGGTHQVSVYLLDWDHTPTRNETVAVLDGTTLAVLNSQTLSNFINGAYVVWNVSGHVKIKVTNNGGNNCTMSGLFFK